jgi:hypothetical protein
VTRGLEPLRGMIIPLNSGSKSKYKVFGYSCKLLRSYRFMAWKNWGDNPIVVAAGLLIGLVGLGYIIYDHHLKSEDTPTTKPSASPKTKSAPSSTEAAFASPTSGAVVPKESDVTGTVRQLTSGEKLWMYVDASGTGKVFLSPIFTRGGTWKTSLWLGSDSPADVGASFEVGLIIADDKLSQKLKAGTNGKGLDVLPLSARKLAPITLTRK